MLMVGFNRRFSPALTMVKSLIAARRAPLVIEYRLNAGYIPLDTGSTARRAAAATSARRATCTTCSDS